MESRSHVTRLRKMASHWFKTSRRLLRAVSLRELPELIAVVIVSVSVEVGLRTVTLPRLARLAQVPLIMDDDAPVISTSSEGLRLPPTALHQLRMTRRVMRHWPFGDTCLRRALVSGQRLRRLRPTLRVGVAKIDGAIQAHAWLEICGVSLDPGAAAYDSLEPVNAGERT